MLAHLHLQLALDDDIALLALMGRQLDIFLFRLGAPGRLHVQRFRDPVPEGRRHVVIHHVVGFLDPLPFSPSGQGKGIQVRAGTFNNIADINAESQRAAVQERKVQIRSAHFAVDVFLFGHAGLVCHLSNREVFNLPQLPNPVSHLLNLVIQPCHLCHTITSPLKVLGFRTPGKSPRKKLISKPALRRA